MLPFWFKKYEPTQMDPQQRQQFWEGQVLLQNLGSISFYKARNQYNFSMVALELNFLI